MERWSSPPLSVALGTALFILAMIAHFPASQAGYIWDDDSQLYQNPLIIKPGGLHKFWFSTKAPDYWPLTSTSFWIEWQIWGDNPTPYHVTNMVLHALASVVLWRVLKRLGIGNLGAFLGGVLFAVHPVTVASVAWIAERKNALSMLLYLLSILAYLQSDQQNNQRRYMLALLTGIAALLAKTSVVALPVLLLVLIWWQRNTITRRDLLRVLPFFVFSLVLGLVTIWFQKHNAIVGGVVRPEGLASRIASVGWAFWFYLYKIVAPINLVMIYPRWEIDGARVLSFVPLAFMIACFIIFWYYRNSWGRGIFVALVSFTIMLGPVLGLLDMSYARLSLVADHFQYVGLPCILALIAGGIAAARAWMQRNNRKGMTAAITVATVCIILTLMMLTWSQAHIFKNEETLWTHNLRLNDRAWIAYNNRGNAYGNRGEIVAAIKDYTRAIELKPDMAEAYLNRGNIYTGQGAYEHALREYNQALAIKPDYGSAYYNRGNAYAGMKEYAKAIEDYTQTIKLKPEFAEAYNNRGAAYANLGNYSQEVQDCTQAIALNPDFANAYKNRAIAFFCLKQYDKAWADTNMCRRLGGTPHPGFLQALVDASGRAE